MSAPKVGALVFVGDGRSLWVVRGASLRIGGHIMLEVQPLGGGSTMTTAIERVRTAT